MLSCLTGNSKISQTKEPISLTANSFVKRSAISTDLRSIGCSEIAGILLRLTVFLRDIRVMAKVDFSNGSSQQGKARLAAVGLRVFQ